MQVKKLTEQNLESLINLENQLFENPFNTNSILSELNQTNRLYLGLFDNDENLIAYAGASLNFDFADIIKVGVEKQHQGKGYGKQVLLELLKELKKLDIFDVLLEVEHQNYKALNLYLSVGFKEISERKNYYGLNSHAKILKLEQKIEN